MMKTRTTSRPWTGRTCATLMGLVAFHLATSGCVPELKDGELACNPYAPEPCPQGFSCLAYATGHRCFADDEGFCGNGRLEAREACDGTHVPEVDCQTLTGRPGIPTCTEDCTLRCTQCGNGVVEQVDETRFEECDDGNEVSYDGCTADCRVEVADWRQWTDPGQEPRLFAPMVYHAGRGEILRVGGSSSAGPQNDTWAFDGQRWRRLTDVGAPTPLHDPAMAYDALRGVLVLVGTAADGYETWELTPAGWHLRVDDAGLQPPARVGARLAYHAPTGQVVLFGGYDDRGVFRDTWTWDGAQWVELAGPAPPARYWHALAHDPTCGALVLFGGLSSGSAALSDTWLFDGQGWQNVTGATFPTGGRFNAGMAHVPGEGLLLQGGGSAVGGRTDLWRFDCENQQWSPVAEGAPPPVSEVLGLAFHAASQRLVHYGTDPQSGHSWTWLLDAEGWHLATEALGPGAREAHHAVYDTWNQRVVLYGGYQTSAQGQEALQDDTWTFDADGWLQLAPEHTPGGRAAYAMAFDSTRGRVLVFGGSTTAGTRNDLWAFDGDDWMELHPHAPYASDQPAPRRLAALTFSPQTGMAILFGGVGSDGRLDDLWFFDADTDRWHRWEPQGAFRPQARTNYMLAADPGRRRLVLFGGAVDGNFVTNDLWEFDGDVWTQLGVAGPMPRGAGSLTYNPDRGTLLLFGGSASSLYLADLWELDPVARTWTQLQPATRPTGRRSFAAAWDERRHRLWVHGGFAALDDVWTFGFQHTDRTEHCANEVDDDEDGLVDCLDPDCQGRSSCPTPPPGGEP